MPETTPELPAETEQPAQAAEPTEGAEIDWKAKARDWERKAKDNMAKLKEAEPIVSQWKALEESTKTDVERAKESEARQLARSEKLQTKLVSASVKALAAADFADPSDALSALDPSKYLGLEDEINEDAIKADLDALLERKPHWRRTADQAPAAPRIPAPNPAQGSGVNGKPAANPAAEFGALVQGLLK